MKMIDDMCLNLKETFGKHIYTVIETRLFALIALWENVDNCFLAKNIEICVNSQMAYFYQKQQYHAI